MIIPQLILAVVFFLLAGYYGAVRALLLEAPFDWHRLRQEEDGHFHQAVYWRRMLRMARLLVVALGCFCLVAAGYSLLTDGLRLHPALAVGVLLLAALVLWLSAYMVWMSVGRRRIFRIEAFPIRFAEWVLTPIYWMLEPFIREKSADGKGAGTRDETAAADDPEFEDHSIEERMFINALDFKDVRIRDCMIPRTEISAVSLEDSIEDLRQAFITSGHSKIIVYRDSVDEVIGYCHSLALFRKPKEISSIITPILIVPEAMPASDLMLRFLEERKSLALVVDEFGGTSGLVSVEDVVEQIFGEIQDEYDSTEDWAERQVDENTYIFSARHEIDYLNEKYDWELPEGDYDTLAGLLIHIHGDLPKVNDEISLPPFTFKIVSMQDTRIELVRLTVESEE